MLGPNIKDQHSGLYHFVVCILKLVHAVSKLPILVLKATLFLKLLRVLLLQRTKFSFERNKNKKKGKKSKILDGFHLSYLCNDSVSSDDE